LKNTFSDTFSNDLHLVVLDNKNSARLHTAHVQPWNICPPDRHTNLADISYAIRVIAHFPQISLPWQER